MNKHLGGHYSEWWRANKPTKKEYFMQWLSNLKLSVAQWAGVMAVAIIGVLVAALKLQGGKLHSTQIKLLETQLEGAIKTDDADVVAKKAELVRQEKMAYNEGKL